MEMTEMIEVIETSPLFDGVWYKKTYQITEDEA